MHLLKSTASLPCAGLSGRHESMPLLIHSLMPPGGLLAYTLPGKDALIFLRRSIKGGFILPQARSITCLCMLYRQIHQRRVYSPPGPVNYMFVHALQADPSKADLFSPRPGQLRICLPTGPVNYLFADAHTVETVFRSFVQSFHRSSAFRHQSSVTVVCLHIPSLVKMPAMISALASLSL